MQKTEFNNHPLWGTLKAVTDSGDQLYDSLDPTERPQVDRIRKLVAFSKAVKSSGANHADRFAPSLLDRLNSQWTAVLGQLQNRVSVSSASYTAQAVAAAEESLAALYNLWPPSTTASQRAELTAVYDELVERARQDVARLHKQRDDLATQLVGIGATAEDELEKVNTRLTELEAVASATKDTIDTYEERVTDIVTDGAKQIAALATENTKSWNTWQKDQTDHFKETFSPFQSDIEARLQEADSTLQALRSTKEEYATLTAEAAAGMLAESFHEEASSGRRTGLRLYGVGFALLILAAVPLALLLIEGRNAATDGQTLWATFAVRAAIGALTASAATVAIRLGGRFIDAGQQSKRTELELRAFGPFLSNVDKSESDTARLEFVDRAFGSRPTTLERPDEVIPVSTFSQILAAVTKLIGR